MATTQAPGTAVVEDGKLISTSPITGEQVGRFPVAGEAEVRDAVARAGAAVRWWRELDFAGRKHLLLRWRSLIAQRLPDLGRLMHREGGKPVGEALIEAATAVDNLAWAARNARRVLGPRRVASSLFLPEHAAYLEYQPYGVVGVIGPWNYPVHTPLGSISYALAAGNAVVFKPSEYTPAVGQWLADSFAEAVGGEPVFHVMHGLGETGAALCRAGVDKLAFTGSPGTACKVMAACAETLTPVLIESGGKDALIVDAGADIDRAAEAAVWGGMTNAGQTCTGIERVYVVDSVYDEFLRRVVERAARLKVGDDADVGAITMPAQIDVIRRHIADALERGGRAALGGPDAVQPPFVHPTILVDVPEDAAAVREETFGPTLTVTRVADAEEALARANDSRYGLGGAVFGRRGAAMAIARRMRAGMVSVNGAVAFAGVPSLPFGGVGDSGFGRIHGADGLREFSRAKAITRRRMRSLVPLMSFDRTSRTFDLVVRSVRLVHGRRWRDR